MRSKGRKEKMLAMMPEPRLYFNMWQVRPWATILRAERSLENTQSFFQPRYTVTGDASPLGRQATGWQPTYTLSVSDLSSLQFLFIEPVVISGLAGLKRHITSFTCQQIDHSPDSQQVETKCTVLYPTVLLQGLWRYVLRAGYNFIGDGSYFFWYYHGFSHKGSGYDKG